jgi:FtsP/CotA-like multicopper oxidase with cupredoxin domain
MQRPFSVLSLVPLYVMIATAACSGPATSTDAAVEEPEPDAALTTRPDTRRPADADRVAGEVWTPGEVNAPAPDAPYVSPGQPAGWDMAVRLPVATDINPDPRIVEINVDARVATVPIDGRAAMTLWTYDGRLPGSMVRARRGDTLLVHFHNHLPEASTIHWHGVRVPVNMDGTPEAQAPVTPGKSFDYRFTLPDAGMYWFHPHMQSAKQVGYGLYAPIIVEDPDEPANLGDELVLVLSDLSPGAANRPEVPDGGHHEDIVGREGSIVLVNGRVKPVVQARRGVRQRWRILNAARSRYFKLALSGHEFVQIGSDGGLMQGPVTRSEVTITPGERVDLLLVPGGESAVRLAVQNLPFDRGTSPAPGPEDLFYLQTTSEPMPPAPSPVPQRLRDIAPLSAQGAVTVDLNFGYDPLRDQYVVRVDNKVVTGNSFHARIGQTQRWLLSNGSDWDHPFHLHGFFFHEIDENDQPVTPIQWKDTINIGARQWVNVLVRFDDRPGMWMYHCHILDHAEVGLIGMVHLEE